MSLRRAFTLIEVMLTIAITALVFAMVGGILLSVLTTIENIETTVESEKAGYGVLATVRRDLAGTYAYALGGLAFRGKDHTELGRDADRLDFVTTADVYQDDQGRTPRLIEIGYRLAPAEGPGNLLALFRRASPLEGDPLRSGVEYVELYGRIESFDVQYLSAESPDWLTEWSEAEVIPKAVKLELKLALTEGQQQAVEHGGAEIPNPVFEMVVGTSTSAGPPPAEEAPSDGG